MSNLNEWAYTEEELAQLEEERDLNNDITIEVEIDNSTKAMKAMETQYDDLSRVFKNIKEAKGINRSLAAEAADVLPNFNGGKSLRSYSTVATMEGYKAALEEINLGMAAAIAGIVAAVAALIVKFISWITGGSSDSNYSKGSFKAKAEEKKKVIEESAPKAKNIYESVKDAFQQGVPLNFKGGNKAIVKSFNDLFKYVAEITEEDAVLGVFSNGSITVTDKSILVLFDELSGGKTPIIDAISDKGVSEQLTSFLINASTYAGNKVEDGDDSPEATRSKISFLLKEIESMKKYEVELDKNLEKLDKIKANQDGNNIKFLFTDFAELLFSNQEKLLKAFTNSYLTIDDSLVQLEEMKEELEQGQAASNTDSRETGNTEVAVRDLGSAKKQYASKFKDLVIKSLKIVGHYRAYLTSVVHSYAFVYDVLNKAEKIIDKYVDKDAGGAEIAAGIREERERAYKRKSDIDAIISTLRSK